MTIKEIKKYLIEKELFFAPIVKNLGRGNNYQVYRIDEKDKSFTLKMNREDIVSNENLKAEYHTLKFLEACKIPFVQRAVFYDAKNSILLLTYIDGREIGINDLNLKQLEVFVKQLNILHRISYKKYLEYCQKNKLKAKIAESPLEHLKRSGIDRFQYIDKNSKEREFVEWIRPRLEKNIDEVKKQKFKESDIIYSHGDLAGANIFLDKGRMFFIDWDKAKFLYNTDYYLNYIFIHSEVSRRKQNKIIEEYVKLNKISEERLKASIRERTQVTKINDIIWAVMMETEMSSKRMEGADKYLRIADRRKREYLKMFE